MENYQSKTEEELLLIIGCYRDSDSVEENAEAEVAFVELLTRHENTIWSIVDRGMRRYSTWNFDRGDLYFRVAEKIWRRAESFSPRRGSSLEAVMKQFLGWAGSILENEMKDDLREIRIDLDPRELEEISELLFQRGGSSHSAKIDAVHEALTQLSQDDQDILRAMALAVPLDGRQMRTSNEDLKNLTARFGITPASLRQKRKRALAKLKRQLESLPVFQ